MFQASSRYDENGAVAGARPDLVAQLQSDVRTDERGRPALARGGVQEGGGPRGLSRRGIEVDLVFAGFVAFLDPPKESAREALKMLERSGITTKIITGDSELVTRKVCTELGFEITGIVLGSDLERMDRGARGGRRWRKRTSSPA